MININRKSIAVKLSIVMLIIIFVQMILMIVGILLSGIMSDLTNNTYNLFETKVENRKDYLENEMNMRFNNIATHAIKIENAYNEFTYTDKLTEDETSPFLIEVAPTLVTILHTTMVTGSFIILDDNTVGNTYSSVYLLDEDPLFTNEFDDDIVMLKGPTEVTREMKIKQHSDWNYGLTLDETNQDIFDKPIQALSNSNYGQREGYWQVSPSISQNGEAIITYSLPLVNRSGKAFGVIGIEISQNQIYKLLPNNEFTEESMFGYIMALRNQQTGEITPLMLEGSLQKAYIDASQPLELDLLDKTTNIYELFNSKDDVSIISSVQNLKLYNNDSPFFEEQWVLIGLVEKEELLNFPKFFLDTLVVIMLFSIVFCVFLVFLAGKAFAQPIVELAKKVHTNDPQTVVSLGRTGFSEIDELSSSIEGLNMRILDVTLKTDKIINMVDLPLSTFEYKKSNNSIMYSDQALHLLGFDKEHDGAITSNMFFEKINIIRQNIEDEQNNIYMVLGNPTRWLKIVSIDNENEVIGVVMDVTNDVLESHAIKFERDYDRLTSLYNRLAFHRNVDLILQKGIYGVTACVMFDLDNLKYINDAYGHDMGDKYIKLTAKILSDNFNLNCVLARMSGDEFYVVLYNYETKDDVRRQVNKIYEAFDIQKLLLPNGEEIKIRMSGGISWYGEDSSSLDELIRFADFAMYQVKNNIKGEIREFDREVYDKESFMLSAREELNKVLDNQLIDYVFQPIVSAKTGKIYGFEVLMRPQSSALASPIKLLQIATAQSQLWKVEKITIYKTLALYKKYLDLFKDSKIFINSITNECLNSEEIEEIGDLYSGLLQNVVLEITENDKIEEEVLVKKREVVKSWGGQIALDDYGSGYNGDISLISIAPDIVKIDMMMIQGIETDRNRQSIVQKLLLYAKEQGIIVLAEGVETYAQMEYLVNVGVDLLQGYYISRPTPLPNFNDTVITQEIQNIMNGK